MNLQKRSEILGRLFLDPDFRGTIEHALSEVVDRDDGQVTSTVAALQQAGFDLSPEDEQFLKENRDRIRGLLPQPERLAMW